MPPAINEDDENDSYAVRQPLLQSSTICHDHQSTVESIDNNMSSPEAQEDKRNNRSNERNEIDGRQAWLTLACIFIINANTLGSLKVYGIIFEEIVSQKYYSREEASWPVSTASTIQNLAGLLTPMLAMKLSWRSIETLQTVLFIAANVGAYFSSCLALDVFCLGIVQGIAFSIRYNMNIVINNEYFIKYRATAIGVSLAGSTCGVFVLKPIIVYVLDISDHKFRNAYLALAAVIAINLLFGFFIRKPKLQACCEKQRERLGSSIQEEYQNRTVSNSLVALLRNPSIHCIWVMQTIYFYVSRTYTIFIVDYGVDSGFSRQDSRDMLNFWVYGELGGRLLLGTLIDYRLLSLKWNIVIVNILLALSGFLLMIKPSSLGFQNLNQQQMSPANFQYFWLFGLSVSAIAALSSLVNILIVPFGQEYLGKKNVPWAFAMGSVVTSLFLLLRPSLIGWSRDYHKSYDSLIMVMSISPLVYALLFMIAEPFLKRYKIRNIRNDIA